MEPTSIKIFLVNGNPKGLRTAELSNWNGKAVASSRKEFKEFLNREEVDSPGFYILVGNDIETDKEKIYIGEGESVSCRLQKNHKYVAEDFWVQIVSFVSKDNNLTKAHIRYLEGKLIEKGKKNTSLILLNGTSSGSKLPEADVAEMDIFLEKVYQLLPILGLNQFNISDTKQEDNQSFLYCNIKGLEAIGNRTDNGFIVYKGSKAVLELRESASPRHLNNRKKLIENDILIKKEEYFLFEKDYEFKSPSAAGSIIRGGNTNGLIHWKDSLGRTLAVIDE